MIVVLLYIHYRPKVLDHIDFFSLNFKRESSYKSLKKEIYFFYDCMQLSNNLNPNKYKVIIITVKVTIFLSITSINYYRENYWLLSNKWKSMLREVIPKQCYQLFHILRQFTSSFTIRLVQLVKDLQTKAGEQSRFANFL